VSTIKNNIAMKNLMMPNNILGITLVAFWIAAIAIASFVQHLF
jgi:hypothetical protein